jgi:hypothetical protein
MGLVALLGGLWLAPARAWASLLVGAVYLVSLGLGATIFVAIQYLFRAGWAVVFRRVPEAMSACLPAAAGLVFLIFLFGRTELYEWARPEAVAASPMLQHKAIYLNAPFFLVRAGLAFAAWIGFSAWLRRRSRQQDADGDLAHTGKNQEIAAGFLVVCAATLIFTSFDWIMSLEPRWSSTLFPACYFAGIFLGGLAAMTLLVIALHEREMLPGVTPEHRHELGRLLCAASAGWAYLWFSQFALIYYTNVPDEAVYYTRRFEGMGGLLTVASLALNAFLPAALLLTPRARRSARRLAGVCAAVLLGRWLDLDLMILPTAGTPLVLGWPEVLIPLACLPLFAWPFVATFRGARPVPQRDPYLGESLSLQP